jgi:hypothetical protein
MDKVEFEFPDTDDVNPRAGGKVVEAEDDNIEIVDDTPEADRGRTPMVEPPKELTEEELTKYDEGVRKRIQHFTKGYHEERRAKEAAQREREEAVRAAQIIAEENKKLKGSLSQGQAALLDQAKKTVEHELADAERKYKEAYEAGDTELLMAAQRELTQVTLKADKVNNFVPTSLQEDKDEVQTSHQQAPAPVDPKFQAWEAQNKWFGANRKMTAYAFALHEDLVQNERISPTSDDYYRRIDAEMRERFPDQFESEKAADAPTQRTPKSNVVAPATRSTAPKKVVLTKSQVEIAKRLGVPLELYARKVADEMRK